MIRTTIATAAVALAASSSLALAGTRRDDMPDSSYIALGNDPAYAPVGILENLTSSGTLIRVSLNETTSRHVLTAAHSVAGNASTPGNVRFTVGGQTYTADQVTIHPNYSGSPGGANDIAVVRLDRTVVNVVPAPIYTGSGELGLTTTIAGFGASGTGLTGATEPGGTKRAGRNVLDRYGIPGENGALSTTTTDGPDRTQLVTDFDDPRLITDPNRAPNQFGSSTPTDLEYNLAVGDSGGGAFINVNGTNFVAGVNVAIADTFALPNAPNNAGTYGDLSIFTRVSRYQSFITNAVPEPSAVGLLGLAALYAVRRPRRR